MSREEHFRKLERMYASAPINDFFRPTLVVGDGTAEITMQIDRRLHHAANAVHGAAYFKLLDDSAFFAVNSLVEDSFVLTAGFNLNLLRPIAAGRMVAVGTVVHRARRLFVAESVLRDERDRVLARGSGSFLRSNIPLSAEVGYR